MNQRAHIRHQVEMPATLSFSHFNQRDCTVLDFCLGGMLMSLTDDDPALHQALTVGDLIRVTLQVQGLRGLRAVQLNARVMRKNGGPNFGVAFESPDSTDLLAVQNHVRSLEQEAPSKRTKSRASRPRAEVQTIAERLLEVLRRNCIHGLELFLPAARSALQEAADKATTNEAQHPYFEAEKVLVHHADTLARNFVTKACVRLEHLAHGNLEPLEAPGEQGNTNLSLVDKDMFEDWLTLKVMASKAEGRFNEDLLHLQLRLDDLFGISLSARRNPLHPAVICNAFGEALRLLPLKQKTDRIILATFEATLIADLGELYAESNVRLAEDGVLPDLDVGRYLSENYRFRKKTPTPRAVTQTPVEPAPEQPAEPDADEPPQASAGSPAAVAPARPSPPAQAPTLAARQFALQQHIARHAYDTVRKLLSQNAYDLARQRSAAGQDDDVPVVSDTQLERTLSLLQRASDEAAADANAPLAERVNAALNQGGGEPLRVDEDVNAAIEVIHHLFQGIVDNPALSGSVRDSIQRLEVAFLRLLLIDDSFLTMESHPARQMLNRMAHLGVRGSANLNAHEQEIDREVSNVLGNFDNNINIFTSSLERLDKMASRQQTLYLRNIKRVTESCDGKEKLVVARREVNQALERRIGGKQVPRAALSLIDAGWRQLLLQSLLRHGRDSREWHSQLGVIDQLLKAVESVPEQGQLSELLATIKSGLGQVDPTQMQNSRLIGELRDLLSQKARSEQPPAMINVPPGVVGGEEAGVSETETDEMTARWIRRAQRHEEGDWFVLLDNGEEIMLRLAWVDQDKRTFVFVNHQGMKIEELSVERFAERLAGGDMKLIDNLDAPAVDRGLESMVQRVYNQMTHHATHDELTELLNRREFERRIKQRLAGHENSACLLHVDIDQFKVVNTYGGPAAGDEMIRQVAEMIAETFPGNLIARLSGDEFAIWIENVPVEAAQRAGEAFSRRIAAQRFVCAGKPYSITVSIGVAQRQPGTGTAAELLRGANSACLAAKESGRNRLQRYTPEDKDLAKRDDVMAWVARLNDAIDNDRLLLRCQRIEPTEATGSAPAYEVLISIADAQGELLAPSEFLHAAERYNRMHALDRWVVSNVLRWMHAHPDVVDSVDHLSINLSGHSLNDTSLLEFLFENFQRYPVQRERICFEVTETAAIANLEDAADFIRELQSLGCRFSLDDFGSGLASYGQLKHLPVDYIKIDGSFIRGIADDPADMALVRSINEMGHLMGKRTIAEYVENDRIRECLRGIGVDYVQGYGVEKPKPLDQLAGA